MWIRHNLLPVLRTILLLSTSAFGLHVIAEDLFPVRLGTFAFSEGTPGITRDDSYIYASRFRSVSILDASDLANIVQIGEFPCSGARAMAVSGDRLYVGDASGLFVLDVSDPITPRQVGAWPTRGGISALALAGNLLYAADASTGNGSDTGGLLILDISEPSPRKVGFAPIEFGAVHLATRNDKACVLTGWGEIFVFDISDPTSPDWIGEWSEPLPETFQIAINADHLFLAAGQQGLKVFDLSENDPVLVGTFAGHRITAVTSEGSHAFVGADGQGLLVLDVRKPQEPRRVGAYPPSLAPSIRNVVVNGGEAMVVDANEGLVLVNATARANPTRVGEFQNPGEMLDVAVSGDHAFVVHRPRGLDVINLASVSQPQFVTNYSYPYSYSISRFGTKLALTDNSTNFDVLDISSPSLPTPWAAHDLFRSQRAVASILQDSRALVLDRMGYQYEAVDPGIKIASLTIIGLENPATSTVLGAWDATGPVEAIAAQGDYAYILGRRNEVIDAVMTIDLSDPENPREVTHALTGAFGYGLDLSGNTLAVANGFGGLLLFDLTDPANPQRLGQLDTPGLARAVRLAPPLAYVADGPGGLVVVDISDRQSPRIVGGNSAFHARNLAVGENFVAVASGGPEMHFLHPFQAEVRLAFHSAPGILEITAFGTPGQRARFQTATSLPANWIDQPEFTFKETGTEKFTINPSLTPVSYVRVAF